MGGHSATLMIAYAGLAVAMAMATGPARGQSALDAAVKSAAADMEAELVQIRRHIHSHPELSNREVATAKFVVGKLREFGFAEADIRTGIAHNGVIALLQGARERPIVAVRADMDALPITEETGLPYASKATAQYAGKTVGVMHACGHDMHTTVLLGVAKVLRAMRERVPGTVVFIFQPCEEGAPPGEEGGASLIVAEGALENPRPEAFFALHGSPEIEVGQLGYTSGPTCAAVDRLKITIRGASGHAAYPWLTHDPVVTAARVVQALQTVHSREVDTRQPSVVSIGIIEGGMRWNIIPDEVKLEGTVRTHNEEVRAFIKQRITELVQSTCESARCTAEVEWHPYGPALLNDPALAEQAAASLKRLVGDENVVVLEPTMGGEDFAYFTQMAPGMFYRLGVRPEGVDEMPPLHNEKYAPDEGCLPLGVQSMCTVVLDYLERQGG
ncbi:MAG: M20 family metallopeptidase [Armatimonadota bacterium]